MVVQRAYAINPPEAFPGMIAEPNSPTRVQRGQLHLDAADARATATPSGARPGDAVYWDNTANQLRVAHTAVTLLRAIGIITYPADTVADANSFVTYADDAEIEVVTMGVVWVTAGGAVEYGNQVAMQIDDFKYDAVTRATAVTDMYTNPFQCYSISGADDGLIKVAVGYGRAV